jgi:hypothetical protein
MLHFAPDSLTLVKWKAHILMGIIISWLLAIAGLVPMSQT